LDLLSDGIPGVAAEFADRTGVEDLVFVFGDTSWAGRARRAWRISGDDWQGRLSAPADPAQRWSGDVPFGALAGALLAAPEPLKVGLRDLLGRSARSSELEMLAPVEAASFGFPQVHVGWRAFHLGRIDFISAGALTNACLHALLRFPNAAGTLRVIDPETVDLTNLNRYLLTRRSACGKPKTAVLEEWATAQIAIHGVVTRLESASADRVLPLAPLVVVGVDNLQTRWVVQALDPAWMAVGSTAGFYTLTSEHDRASACVACLHPFDDGVRAVIPTISFASYWSGLTLAFRVVRQRSGQPLSADRQALELFPLHLDNPDSYRWRAARRNTDCPLRCAA
jgi:hypothetical protein